MTIPLTGHNTVADLIDAINQVYQIYDNLGTASLLDAQVSADDIIADRVLKVGAFGMGGQALSATDANNTILGSYTYFSATEAQCAAKFLPTIDGAVGTENRIYMVLTFGRDTAVVQFATELLSEGLDADSRNPQFKRVKNSGTWGSWYAVGSGSGGAKKGSFYEGNQIIATDYTVPVGKNAMTPGPVTIADGFTVEVSPGSTWTVV